MSKRAVLATAMTVITPAWTGSLRGASHVQADDEHAFGAYFLDCFGNLAAHQRPRQDQGNRAGQAWHGADGVGQVLLADDGNRVDADFFAADVVPVGLGNGTQRDLTDLGAAANDDDAFAEHLEHARHPLDAVDDVEPFEVTNQCVFVVDAVQLPEDGATVAALEDVHRVDVPAVAHDDAGHLVQDPGPIHAAAHNRERWRARRIRRRFGHERSVALTRSTTRHCLATRVSC